jgi:hypothetical protein
VNGDGFVDVIIGAVRQNNQFSGAAYVIYGASTKHGVWSVMSLNISTGFILLGPAWSWFGYSVSGAGKKTVAIKF